MLILNYNPNNTTNSILVGDGTIEQYLLATVKLPFTVNISQISIIYVLRKLIAQKKIKHTDVLVSINDIMYTINQSGRFDSHPPGNDLFDDCLDGILNSASSSDG